MNITAFLNSRKRSNSKIDSVQTSSVFLIPEILSNVLSFLTQHTLKNSARYVSKDWFALVKPLIRVQATWRETDDHTTLLPRLHQVTDLHMDFTQQRDFASILSDWGEISEKVDSLRQSNQLKISKLSIVNAACLKEIMYPVMSKLSTLTEIHITRVLDSRIHIGVILALCPGLRELKIDHEFYGARNHWIDDDTTPSWPRGTSNFQESAIERLIIKGMRMEQNCLERVLARCSQLRVLKLMHIYSTLEGSRDFDGKRFFSAVANSCPLLKLFHFSRVHKYLDLDGTRHFLLTFFPGIQLNTTTTCTTTTIREQVDNNPHQNFRPSLDTLSILNMDTIKENAGIIFSPLIDAPSFVTTLELVSSKDQSFYPFNSSVLHSFLCSAPCLLHLLAPKVMFFVEHFDLSGAVSEDRQNCLDYSGSRIEPSPGQEVKKQIWACRGLRTLHLLIGNTINKGTPIDENSRIIFGYISLVCPNLRDLHIERWKLNIKINGGFCFLARLKSLERLSILTWTVTRLENRDISWMARYPVERTKPWTRWKSRRRSSRSSTDKDFEMKNISLSPDDVGVDDVIYASLASKLKEFRELLSQGVDEAGYLPVLESLSLRLGLLRRGGTSNSDHRLSALISSVRPDVEFTC